MLEISLTQGFVALIDDEDLPLVEGYSWNVLRGTHTNYAHTGRSISLIYMHHLILPPLGDLEVDHRDGNGLNNCRSNLQRLTHSQNLRKGNWKPGRSGERGIIRHRQRWLVRVSINNETVRVGSFTDMEEAKRARDAALERLGVA